MCPEPYFFLILQMEVPGWQDTQIELKQQKEVMFYFIMWFIFALENLIDFPRHDKNG